MAETIDTEELEGLCREICREMVPNWDIGAGPGPGPGATTRSTRRREGGRKEGGRREESGRNMNERGRNRYSKLLKSD